MTIKIQNQQKVIEIPLIGHVTKVVNGKHELFGYHLPVFDVIDIYTITHVVTGLRICGLSISDECEHPLHSRERVIYSLNKAISKQGEQFWANKFQHSKSITGVISGV